MKFSTSSLSPLFLRADIDAAIIDLDGTMVDTMGDFVLSINLMLGEVLPGALPQTPQLPRAVVGGMVGKGSENLIKSVLEHVAAHYGRALFANKPAASERFLQNDTLFNAAFASYQKHYLAINGQQAQVYAGVVEGLQALQASGLKLVCLTNKPLAFARTLLRLKGLDGFFIHVFGGDSFEHKKPHPLPLLKACEALGTMPSRTLMIGDSSNDAQAARAAGCPVILLTYGYNHGEPVSGVDADGLIDSLTALRLQT